MRCPPCPPLFPSFRQDLLVLAPDVETANLGGGQESARARSVHRRSSLLGDLYATGVHLASSSRTGARTNTVSAERARFGFRSQIVHGTGGPTSALRDSASAADVIRRLGKRRRLHFLGGDWSWTVATCFKIVIFQSRPRTFALVGVPRPTTLKRRQFNYGAKHRGLAAFDARGRLG